MEADLIKQNPMLKEPIRTVLALATEANDEQELVERAEEVWKDTYSQTPGTVIAMLVRHNALTSQTFMNGEVYEGTLEDMQLDETVPDDAIAEVRIALTDEGQQLYELYAPEHTLAQLFDERPQYAPIFTAILNICNSESGSTREQVENAITEHPDFKAINEGAKRIYPQYFIDALETAGGITWNTTWHSTEAGQHFITQQ